MKIRINRIVPRSYTDGPGLRTVVFLQGCDIKCPGCQSPHTWDVNGGVEHDVEDIAETLTLLANGHGNITISGGEPFMNPEALLELIIALRRKGVKHIVVYTGYTLGQLQSPNDPAAKYGLMKNVPGAGYALQHGHRMLPVIHGILLNIDVLVDGPFVANLDHNKITWRGSSNQRVIDVPASIAANEVITLDWDNQFTITPEGNLVMPVGFAYEFAEIGEATDTRRCGQSNGRYEV